jgi:Skp family chaperone for outer membrane proteins
MTSFLRIYNDIEQKLAKATLQLVELQEVVKQLQAENAALKQQALAREKNEQKEKENINTQINKTSNETIYKIKEEINDIVREIDNCIGILNAE